MWFTSNCVYKGYGRAEFSGIRGTIEGEAEISFDETGRAMSSMKVEKLTTSEDLHFGLFQFLNGQQATTLSDGAVGIGFGGGQNKCESLSINTDHGTFLCTEDVSLGNWSSDPEVPLQFHVTRSQFDSGIESEPVYWVMPVCNLISKFVRWGDQLDQHPMRFRLSENSERQQLINRTVIDFLFNGKLAYIEPLPDYEDRVRRLNNGESQSLISAVMVGEVQGNSIELSKILDWIPSDFLRLLSLATGTRAGSPWIEFRDATGNLIRRCHVTMNIGRFGKGHAPLREGIHSGIGYLLTQYGRSADRNKPYLSVLLKQVAHGASHHGTIEDSLVYLFRAFEGLLDYHGYKTQNLLRNLDATNAASVRTILQTAEAAIKNLAVAAQQSAQSSQADTLNRIASRIIQTSNTDRDFGLSVYDLLTHYTLADASIVDSHYATTPRSDGVPSFGRVLSKYRGAVIHESYFEFSLGNYDFNEVLQIRDHLLDILLRMIFQIVRYDGTYQPSVIKLSASEQVGWVTPTTKATTLGY